MEWSSYQKAVFDFNINGTGNCFVNATAGSGKTTVIEEAIRQDYPSQTLAMAFGVAIKDELLKRLGTASHVVVKTFNGFGNSCLPRGRRNLTVEKYSNIVKFDVLKDDKDAAYKLRRPVSRLCGLMRASMIWEPTPAQTVQMIDDHGITIPKGYGQILHSVLTQTLQIGLNKFQTIDYDDQIALPLYHDFDIPRFPRVKVDEAQDLTPAQIELAKRAMSDRGMFVGDRRQAIYQFRGADSNAVGNIVTALSCQMLPLSISYRCAKAIVREAQKVAPEMEAFEGNPEGVVDTFGEVELMRRAVDGNIILCRTTAPLVSLCMKFIGKGQKAIVKGRDIGQGLVDVLEAAGCQGQDGLEVVTAYYLERSETMQGQALASLTDSYETLCCLYEQQKYTEGVLRMISQIFRDDSCPGITLMTIHRSKGLENETVFFLRPSLLPHKFAVTDEQLIAEDNLRFVATTRAKRNLFYVEG